MRLTSITRFATPISNIVGAASIEWFGITIRGLVKAFGEKMFLDIGHDRLNKKSNTWEKQCLVNTETRIEFQAAALCLPEIMGSNATEVDITIGKDGVVEWTGNLHADPVIHLKLASELSAKAQAPKAAQAPAKAPAKKQEQDIPFGQ